MAYAYYGRTITRKEVDVTLVGLFILLVIAAIAGSLGQAISGYSIGGCLISVVVGFIGAFLGMWISRQIGLPEPLPIRIDGETFPVMWSIIGSALFTGALGLLTRRRRRPIL
jgi:uncharacterized membrane protein YeaQ/YmgE (transglycosylase-associated protein family)